MSLHFNNGQLLLQNTTDDEWYYLGINLVEGIATIAPSQDAVTTLGSYSAYAVLTASDGEYWKLSLSTVDEVVTYSIEQLTTPEPSIKLWLKALETGVFYQLQLNVDANDGMTYAQIVDYNNVVVSSFPLPWRAITPVEFVERSSVIINA